MRDYDADGTAGAAARMRRSIGNRHDRSLGKAITQGQIRNRLKQQKGRCAATGLPLDCDHNGAYQSPFAPSPDRIDNSEANYTPENVQIVSLAYNVSRNRFPRANLSVIAQAIAWGPVWTQLATQKQGQECAI